MPTFTNQATLTYNSTSTNSNIVTGNLLDVLSATKTAVVGSYFPDDDITYILSVVNTGSAPFAGLTITDDLGAYAQGDATLVPLTYTEGSLRYYINGVLQPAPAVTAGDTLVITGITVPANGNVTLVYEATVNGFAPPAIDGAITNTATVSGDTLTNPVTAEETVTAAAAPLLSISKSLSPTDVAENGILTYTFVIQNTGNTAAGDAVLTDTFDPRLSNISVTVNGETLTPAEYTYDGATGLFTLGGISVPAASFTRDETTGAWVITPGVTVITVTGTV